MRLMISKRPDEVDAYKDEGCCWRENTIGDQIAFVGANIEEVGSQTGKTNAPESLTRHSSHVESIHPPGMLPGLLPVTLAMCGSMSPHSIA